MRCFKKSTVTLKEMFNYIFFCIGHIMNASRFEDNYVASNLLYKLKIITVTFDTLGMLTSSKILILV